MTSQRMHVAHHRVLSDFKICRLAVNTVDVDMGVIHAQLVRIVLMLVPKDHMSVVEFEILYL